VGPEIRAERVFDAAQRIGPRLQGVHGVAQDAHDLGLAAGEALLERVQRGGFAVSGVREREREEREHHALAAVRRKLDLASVVGTERELGRNVTDLEGLRVARDLRSTLPGFR
jgi:uncharacterized NAD-dependent epimerase/dehydratase family protein